MAPTVPTQAVKTQTTTTTVEESAGVGAVSKDSRIWGVSVMAWVLLIVTVTVCALNFMQVQIYDHLVNLSLVAIGFYAGQKSAK